LPNPEFKFNPFTGTFDLVVDAGEGSIYITDVTVPGGTASGKDWQNPVEETVLQEVTVSDTTFDVHLVSSYPLVTVHGVNAELPLHANGTDYAGSVSVTITGPGKVVATVNTPDDKTGAKDTVQVNIDLPPTVTAVNFNGPYPTGPYGLQTEVKEGDTFQLQVWASKDFDAVEILDYGAGQADLIIVPAGTSATVTLTVANRGTLAQQLPARVRVRDASTGAFSATRDTNTGVPTPLDGVHVITLNNLFPSGSIIGYNYPGIQLALKLFQQATVDHTASNFDVIQYSDPTGIPQIVVENDSTFEASKTVTCQNPGLYNDSIKNFRYLMTRNANGSQTTVEGTVVIADIAAVITMILPYSRLRSGGEDGTLPQDYTITLSSNQPLLNAPSLSPAAGGDKGSFIGSFSGGPSMWTRTFRVDETVPDQKGVFAWTGLVATNLADTDTTVVGVSPTYELGGFVQRTVTWAAFQTLATVNVEVVDFSKVQAGLWQATNQQSLRQPIGTSPPVTDGYTIDATGVNPTTVIWLDTDAASSNSGTADLYEFEEIV